MIEPLASAGALGGLAATAALVGALWWRVGPPRPRWPLGPAFGALALLVGIAALVGVLGGVLLGRPWIDPAPPLALGIGATGAGALAAGGLALRMATPRALGLLPPEAARGWGEAAAGLVAFLAFTVAFTTGLQALGVELEAQGVLTALAAAPPTERALVVGYGLLGAPLSEELLFRGLLLPPLVQRLGAPAAVLVSGLIFGLAHLADPVAVVPLVVLGAGLALLRLRTGSVLPGLAVHVVNNGVALATAAL